MPGHLPLVEEVEVEQSSFQPVDLQAVDLVAFLVAALQVAACQALPSLLALLELTEMVGRAPGVAVLAKKQALANLDCLTTLPAVGTR